MKKGNVNKAALIIIWVIITFISIYIGYLICGAIPKIEGAEDGYGARLLSVLSDPFKGYFNEYSLVGMIVGFIVSEIIFGFVFLLKFSSAAQMDTDLIDVNEMAQIKEENKANEEILVEEVSVEDVKDKEYDIKNNFETIEPEKVSSDVSGEQTEEINKVKKSKKNRNKDKQADEDEKEFTMSQDIFINLYNQGYTNDQIKAMMEVTEYIPDIDVNLLTRMFNKSMEPENIREYIELLYG